MLRMIEIGIDCLFVAVCKGIALLITVCLTSEELENFI